MTPRQKGRDGSINGIGHVDRTKLDRLNEDHKKKHDAERAIYIQGCKKTRFHHALPNHNNAKNIN
jgi:hypothetical protein